MKQKSTKDLQVSKAYKKRSGYYDRWPKKKLIKLQEKMVYNDSGSSIVPELRISGKWLASSGFHAGEQIEITYGYEYMVIYPHIKKVS